MSAPLTTARLGSTHCVGCEQRLVEADDITVTEGTEPVRNRYGGFSDGRHRPVSRRWHTACLEDFDERQLALRAQVAEDRRNMVREMGRAAGMSEERIEQIITAAEHVCTDACDPGNCETAHRDHFGVA
jgi:hypothetical protein